MSKRTNCVVASAALAGLCLVPTAGLAGTAAPARVTSRPIATNGHTARFVASGLHTPTSFAIGDGRTFVGDAGSSSDSSKASDGGLFVLRSGVADRVPSPFGFVAGLAWHDGALYGSGGVPTSDGMNWQIIQFSGWNGSGFAQHRTVYTGPSGFDGFNGIGFGANGRLFAAVDVGLTDGNDHGPATTSPHVYQILSMGPAGGNLRVFARGIRQPWQLAFPARSSSPYVTDLGQDFDSSEPPDFILRVKAGQDYGYPTCNHAPGSDCAGYAQPFESFGPHTDLMGIALHDSRLYVSSFQGSNGQGPGGEVLSLPARGGVLQPLITGFAAPTVGLAIHGRYVYVGELAGKVYRLLL